MSAEVSTQTISYLRIGGTLALIVILVVRVDLSQVIHVFGRFAMRTWVTSLLLYLVAWAIAAVKWKTLLPRHSIRSLFALNFVAQYYSMLLPGQLAGEIVKAYRVGKGTEDAGQVAASVIVDRITGFIGLLAVAIGGIAFSRSEIDPRIISALAIASVILLVGLFCFKLPWWLHTVRSATGRLGRFGVQARRLIDAWKSYLDQPAVLVINTALAVLFQLTAVWVNLLFARELGLDIAFADWCWLFGLISIVTMLPFTIGGVGLREGSFVGSLALLGIQPEKAVALSFAVFSLILVGAAIGGALDWTHRRSQGA